MSQPATTNPDQHDQGDDAQPGVNSGLTPEATATTRRTATRTRRTSSGAGRKRRRAEVENTDYAAFAARVIRAHARRIADGDVDALADLLRLAVEVDTATQTAVTGLRGFGYSWGEIAARLGTTRQATQQRWGRFSSSAEVTR